MKSQDKKKVYVGMSGGVDSAVSAGLLKVQGYDVHGVFIKAWNPEWMECTWKEDRRSAMRACAVLDIPFYTLDLEKEYKEGVVDYMIREYKQGRTPNPDVMCNKEIKFGAFLRWALARGADYVATGHYARVSPSPDQGEGRVGLLEGLDKNKDQSYFLWTLTQDQLKHILFPVGGLEKPKVRKLALKFKLPQAVRKDSQGLCFLGQVDMKEFLARYIETKRGDVLNVDGEIIGYHEGAAFFTLGERHGFTITKKGSEDEPFYVLAKDVEKNIITVGHKKDDTFFAGFADFSKKKNTAKKVSSFLLQDVVLNTEIPKGEIECRFRYRQNKLGCKVNNENGKIYVEFSDLEEMPASGQSVVLYKDEVCLGGGIIG